MQTRPLHTKKDLHVGLCGAGLGGLAAAIAIAHSGARVTVLEAAAELGEIGAGIQMTPNVSRFLIKYGVADIIGDDLVACDDLRMRTRDSKIVQYTELIPKTQRELGFPWWVVHRAHLHGGLAEAARRRGVTICIDSRVTNIEHSSNPVIVTTEKGAIHEFDLLIGSDGLKSIVRSTLFPYAKPIPLTANAAYRAIIPYDKIFREVPEARQLFRNSITTWFSERSYIITYPVSGGRELNLVLEHHQDRPVYDVEDADISEVLTHYHDYDPLLQKVLRLIPATRCWPLLQLGPLESWSSPQKNVVLMGDAAHSMVNHMAQGAATSIEDGVYLARLLHEVVYSVLTLPEAIHLYERGRMPRAWQKQQISFLQGAAYMYEDEPRAHLRDLSSRDSVPDQHRPHTSTHHPQSRRSCPNPTAETQHDANNRSWNYWGAPSTVPSLYTYDAEGDADYHLLKYLMEERSQVDPHTRIASGVEEKLTGWYLPREQVGRVAKSRL